MIVMTSETSRSVSASRSRSFRFMVPLSCQSVARSRTANSSAFMPPSLASSLFQLQCVGFAGRHSAAEAPPGFASPVKPVAPSHQSLGFDIYCRSAPYPDGSRARWSSSTRFSSPRWRWWPSKVYGLPWPSSLHSAGFGRRAEALIIYAYARRRDGRQ
jgi:hypothetical protein